MDWLIHIKRAEDLAGELSLERLATLEGSEMIRPTVRLAARLILAHYGQVEFTRCVFGNEFCEHLIPTQAGFSEALTAARTRSLDFTFLTPYVTDRGIATLRPLFALLNEGDGGEVVFSDWGVLNVLRSEFPRLKPVQGRLLNKSLRDPRVMGVYAITSSGSVRGGTAAGVAVAASSMNSTLASLQRSNLDSPSCTNLLARLGVTGVEMDNLPQGIDLGFAGRGLEVGVYLPFGFISSSRVCMAAGLHYRKADKFQPGAVCRHECQTHLLEYAYTNSPFGNRDQKFYLRGNTYFFVHTESMLATLFEQARLGRIDRLIFQPRVPM